MIWLPDLPYKKLAPRDASTTWVWLIALSPTVQILFWIVWTSTGQWATWTEVAELALAGLLANLAFAYRDRSLLVQRGFEDAVSPYWALLPPFVYLGWRGNRVFNRTAGGFAPLWAFLGQFAVWFLVSLIAQLWGGAIEQLH